MGFDGLRPRLRVRLLFWLCRIAIISRKVGHLPKRQDRLTGSYPNSSPKPSNGADSGICCSLFEKS